MAEPKLKPVVMEGVRIIFRNFKGEKNSSFNQEGTRTFSVILPPEVVEPMTLDGWNVKTLKPTEEEEEAGIEHGPAHLPIEAAYNKGRPPKIVLITSRGPTILDEDTVAQLDGVDIATDPETGNPMVDLIVNPHRWGPNAMGKSGVKAYLKSMYITIEEDELAQRYGI